MNNDMRTLAFNLSQPLFVGGKLYQAYKMAGLGAEMAALSLQSHRYLLLSEVESKYLSALQLRTVLQLSQSELQSAKDNLTIAKLKLDNGIISQPDYLRFQGNLASKEVSALQADTALQIVLRDFANYLGSVHILMPEELSIANEQSLIDRLDAYDLTKTQLLSQKAMQMALQRNLGIKTLDKSVELSERAYSLAKGSFLPTLMLTGSRQYKENGFDRYEFSPSNQIMLNLSIPILPGLGNYASMQKAKEEARKTALENKTATDGIKLGLESVILTWISSAKQINSASLALAYSEEFYAQMQERFNQNMLSAKDLLDAELMLSAAKLAHSNAFFAYLKARSVMMQSLAIDNPNDLIGLLDN
jgi:outer membrane protein TolC